MVNKPRGNAQVVDPNGEFVDPVIRALLPRGTSIIRVTAHGRSTWSQTSKILTQIGDGELTPYFLKTARGDRGKGIVSGEYASLSAINDVRPGLAPRPVAYGSYADNEDIHFILCEFHNMIDELPDIDEFVTKIAELHRESHSPNGKFGFHMATYHGCTAVDHGWVDKWEDYFTTTTLELLLQEQQVQGPNREINELAAPFFEKVVPRLLRPMETGGHMIKPSLIHGDLWHGNIATDADTNRPIIFDAGSFYAHNEYELGVWRAPWNKIGITYVSRYHNYFPKSHPVEDYDDRNALYAIVNILDSILYCEDPEYRERFIPEMKRLVEKFPGGYEAWEDDQATRKCERSVM